MSMISSRDKCVFILRHLKHSYHFGYFYCWFCIWFLSSWFTVSWSPFGWELKCLDYCVCSFEECFHFVKATWFHSKNNTSSCKWKKKTEKKNRKATQFQSNSLSFFACLRMDFVILFVGQLFFWECYAFIKSTHFVFKHGRTQPCTLIFIHSFELYGSIRLVHSMLAMWFEGDFSSKCMEINQYRVQM